MDYKDKVIALLNSQELSKEQKEKLELIFPELKESEVERIVKELLTFFRESIHGGHILTNKEYDSWIAWLEKQGENVHNEELSKLLNEVICHFINNPDIPYSKRDEVSKKIIPYVEKLEKQGEKPIDKIQLGKKYKCIASPRYSTFMIGKIYKPEDKFLCSLMNFCSDCFEPIEGEQKPNPVLDIEIPLGAKDSELQEASYYIPEGFHAEIEGNRVVIKRGEQKPADKVEPKFRVKYAGSEYNVLEVKDIAGVTFYGIEDEPNHIDYVLTENCERVGGYAIKENGSPYPTKPAVFSEQKSSWSEDDENRINRLIAYFEDKESFTAEDDVVYANWLKSLRPQSQWKPSRVQMDALDIAIRCGIQLGSWEEKALKSLKEQLFKL